ncbi:MAG: hypothetical protein V4438_00880 [Patescibacteria group bacterium]
MKKKLIIVVGDGPMNYYVDALNDTALYNATCAGIPRAIQFAQEHGNDIDLVITQMYGTHGPELDSTKSERGHIAGAALKDVMEILCPSAIFMIMCSECMYDPSTMEKLRACPNVRLPGNILDFLPYQIVEEVGRVLK